MKMFIVRSCYVCGVSLKPVPMRVQRRYVHYASTRVRATTKPGKSEAANIWQHQPVMFRATLEWLGVLGDKSDRPRTIIDATFGNGGHSRGILGKTKPMRCMDLCSYGRFRTCSNVSALACPPLQPKPTRTLESLPLTGTDQPQSPM